MTVSGTAYTSALLASSRAPLRASGSHSQLPKTQFCSPLQRVHPRCARGSSPLRGAPPSRCAAPSARGAISGVTQDAARKHVPCSLEIIFLQDTEQKSRPAVHHLGSTSEPFREVSQKNQCCGPNPRTHPNLWEQSLDIRVLDQLFG